MTVCVCVWLTCATHGFSCSRCSAGEGRSSKHRHTGTAEPCLVAGEASRAARRRATGIKSQPRIASGPSGVRSFSRFPLLFPGGGHVRPRLLQSHSQPLHLCYNPAFFPSSLSGVCHAGVSKRLRLTALRVCPLLSANPEPDIKPIPP